MMRDERGKEVDVDVSERRQGQRRWHPILQRHEWLVSAGAILGVWARFAISDYVSHHVSIAFPVATLVINLLGCLLIGSVQALFLDLLALRRELQLFLAVGLLGGFTTFSTFSVETIQLIEAGHAGRAGLYVFLSLVGGPLIAVLGILLAHRGYDLLRPHVGPLR
ncbi:MAG: fluoride efflux transporter CrcB [Herpetosiphonaceae bacterium]|nr:fluoride efflux transporter CrcB [Herpetosiphonaceae bacterium]